MMKRHTEPKLVCIYIVYYIPPDPEIKGRIAGSALLTTLLACAQKRRSPCISTQPLFSKFQKPNNNKTTKQLLLIHARFLKTYFQNYKQAYGGLAKPAFKQQPLLNDSSQILALVDVYSSVLTSSMLPWHLLHPNYMLFKINHLITINPPCRKEWISIYQSVINTYQSVINTYQSVINTYHSVIYFYCILLSYFTPQSPAHLMGFLYR